MLLYINILIIGASLSKPHTYDEYAAAVCMCVYIYIYIYVLYVMPYSSICLFTIAVASEPL